MCRINQAGSSSHEAAIYRVPQSTQSQPEKRDKPQQEARSSYSFRDSRHVVKGGGASVSFDLEVEDENAEHVELLGFQQGDSLRLDGLGSISGTALITVLTKECLEVQMDLRVPSSALRAAATVFERLSPHPYHIDEAGQVSLTSCVSQDGKGGYTYRLLDRQNQQKHLMADVLNLRIDTFSTHNIQHQVLTFIVESGNNISFAIEMQPGKVPTGKLKVSLAPGMGEFEVTKQAQD